jgi:IS1 family transposase
LLKIMGLQLDEAWSFVGKKRNKVWIWVAFEPGKKQVVAFHIGGRGIDSAKALWRKIPRQMRLVLLRNG